MLLFADYSILDIYMLMIFMYLVYYLEKRPFFGYLRYLGISGTYV